jgi:hypothetical protein
MSCCANAALMLLEAAYNLFQADAQLASQAAYAALACTLSMMVQSTDNDDSCSGRVGGAERLSAVGMLPASLPAAATSADEPAAAAATAVNEDNAAVAGSTGSSSSSSSEEWHDDFNMAELLKLVSDGLG